MKTPYDAALRVRQRELDEVSTAIRAEAGALSLLEREGARVRAVMRAEAQIAASDLALASPAWQGRMRGQGHELGTLQAQAQVRVDRLRDAAVDAYGTLRGIETAADDYRRDSARAEAAAEQATSDDLSAAAFLKTLRAARRESPR
jgi:hypothetical protein